MADGAGVYLQNCAAAVKLSQVGILTPDYANGRLYALIMGVPVLVYEIPEEDKADEDRNKYLEMCIEDIYSGMTEKDKEKKSPVWKPVDYKKKLQQKRKKEAEEKERRRVEAEAKRVAEEAKKKREEEERKRAEELAAQRERAAEESRERYFKSVEEKADRYNDTVKQLFYKWQAEDFARKELLKKYLQAAKDRGREDDSNEIAWEWFKDYAAERGVASKDFVGADITRRCEQIFTGFDFKRMCIDYDGGINGDVVDEIAARNRLDLRPSMTIHFSASTFLSKLKGKQILQPTGERLYRHTKRGDTTTAIALGISEAVQAAIKENAQNLSFVEACNLCPKTSFEILRHRIAPRFWPRD